MGLCLNLHGSVNIDCPRLALLHHLIQLVVLSWCIRTWIETKGGTTEISILSQASIEVTSGSFHAASHYNKTADHMCKDQNFKELANNTIFAYVCTDLYFKHCPIGQWVQYCFLENEAFRGTNPFEERIVISKWDVQGTDDPELGFFEYQKWSFHTFTQSYIVNLSYRFVTAMNVPTAFGMNDGLRTSGTNRHAKTVLLNRDGMPQTSFAPGEDILVPLPWFLQLAETRGGAAADIPHSDGSDFHMIPGDRATFPTWIWLRGATLNLKLHCFTHDYDAKEMGINLATSLGTRYEDSAWNLGASVQIPVCVVSVEMAKPASRIAKVWAKWEDGDHFGHVHDIHVVCEPQISFFRAFDIQAGILFLTSAFVLLQMPRRIMRFLTLHCLGRLSHIYRCVVCPVFNVRYHCAKAAMQLVSQSAIFEELADQRVANGVERGGISHRRMREQFSALYRKWRAVIDDGEVEVLADFAFGEALKGTRTGRGFDLKLLGEDLSMSCLLARGSRAKTKGSTEAILDIDSFCLATGSDEISFDMIAHLFDRDRRPWPLERLFFPADLWRKVHDDARDAGCGLGEGPPHQRCEPPTSERELELAVHAIPLESETALVTQVARENPCVSRDCSVMTELVAGLQKKVDSLSSELSEMCLRMEKMQADLFSEAESRAADDAALGSEFKGGLQELRATLVGMAASETDRKLEQSSAIELCKKAELEMREYGARLQKEIIGRQMEALSELELCNKMAVHEMRQNGARLQEKIAIADGLGPMWQQAAMDASAAAAAAAEAPTVKERRDLAPLQQINLDRTSTAVNLPVDGAHSPRLPRPSSMPLWASDALVRSQLHPLEVALEPKVNHGAAKRFASMPPSSIWPRVKGEM